MYGLRSLVSRCFDTMPYVCTLGKTGGEEVLVDKLRYLALSENKIPCWKENPICWHGAPPPYTPRGCGLRDELLTKDCNKVYLLGVSKIGGRIRKLDPIDCAAPSGERPGKRAAYQAITSVSCHSRGTS
ncbi:hypothetical protein BaRGS_00022506 [Batillaria attramentaria]|uniref:Uncharacterized protein n=1 Tax=Batillaria attramentaria TaxID=370345 RepID=A0ABD0KGM2_9CAEN